MQVCIKNFKKNNVFINKGIIGDITSKVISFIWTQVH